MLARVLERIGKGDTLVVVRIDRLARSLSHLLEVIERLEAKGAAVDYHDPHVPVVPPTREHARLAGRRSVALTEANLAGYDAVLIATAHAGVDSALVGRAARLVVDTRNALAGIATATPVVKA